ncbi:hypothetical protein CNMCM5793_006829 [Aspergillus hiratsukae]|uniref:Uncharacterized protein n=1 Tax=Aspergillus hiratsukae TaxID=1194566 RepID=A0A8H6PH50_9EURO|nr:hypothetical protein CNMCM5793_006829 [Aspergillus hiratsukae]
MRPTPSSQATPSGPVGNPVSKDLWVQGFNLSSAEQSQSSSSLHEVESRHSDSSALTPDKWSRSEGEGLVNVALVELLSTLTITCKGAKLDWSRPKKRLDFSLGHANVRSINDGSLRARYTGDILAVLEVKPIRLIEKGLATLMQMGLEMMSHILDCEEKKMAKKSYWMLSQHFDEIYFTWAEMDDGYIDYLRHGHCGDETLSFMHLKFVGPFHIYNSEHMYDLGRLALSLTVQESEDFAAHISRTYSGASSQGGEL